MNSADFSDLTLVTGGRFLPLLFVVVSGVKMNHVAFMIALIKAASGRQSPAGEDQESFSLGWEFPFYGFHRKRK